MISLICGRGESLKSYKDYFDKKIDYIYLVNEFNKFITQDVKLLEFLNKKSNEGTKIIQIVNIEMKGLDHNFLKQVKVREVFSTRLKYNQSSEWWRDYYDPNRFLNTLGLIVKPQPEIMEPYMHKVGNSLLAAVLNAILLKNSKEVHVIGKDFYESFYYGDESDKWSSSHWNNENTLKTKTRLKNELTHLVECFPKIKFKITTQSKYKNDLSNCNVVNII